jgi:hypothetical protein
MSHDQLAKCLLETFFAEFLRLTVPDSAQRLRPSEATFMDKEFFLDWPDGNRREIDLLAKVPKEGGSADLLVHVEIESKARAGMDQRLWRYYMQIRLRHELLVLPILVNLRGGRPGVRLEVLEEGQEDVATGVFRYRVLGLSGCHAEDWLARPEPVAWAFAALMRPGSRSRAELKVECLRRISESGETGFRKEVLVNWVHSCVKLTGEHAAQYRRILELDENKEIQEMELTWLGKAEAKGMKKGLAQGRAQGRQEGKEKATLQHVDRLRRAVLHLMKGQFGTVPVRVRRRLEAIDSIEPLAEMIERIPRVRSAEELLTED